MDAHRHYGPAAFALAVEAWRQGNDVYTALSQAGYAATIANGLASYVASPFFSPDTAVTQTDDDEMSAKRARTDTTASVAPGVKKYVRSCMDRLVEEKVYTQNAAAATPGVAGVIRTVGVSAIVNGTTSVTRVGDVIHIDRLLVNWYAYDSNPGQLRVILFIDRQANGTTPNVSDVLAYSTVTSPPNPFNTIGYGGSRFKILSDEVQTISTNITAVVQAARVHQKDWKLKVPVVYTASTGAAADVLKNNLWLLIISDQTTASISYSTGLYYRDN